MQPKHLLIVMILLEVGTGLLALVCPSILLELLLGVTEASPESFFFARIGGSALLSLSIAWWAGRGIGDRSAQKYLLLSVLVYDLAAAGILAYTGSVKSLAGIGLWPAVGLHAALAVWCSLALREGPVEKRDRDLPVTEPKV